MTSPAQLAVRNLDRETTLGTRVKPATRWWERARGLLFQPRLRDQEGMLIRPCRAVHMMGMTYPVDVAFLDAEGAVIAIYAGLRPGRTTRYHRSAEAALELPAGALESSQTRVGDRLATTSTTPRG